MGQHTIMPAGFEYGGEYRYECKLCGARAIGLMARKRLAETDCPGAPTNPSEMHEPMMREATQALLNKQKANPNAELTRHDRELMVEIIQRFLKA